MKVSVRKDPRKGRGLYAEVLFSKGDLIEECELIFLDLKDVPAALEGYVFQYTEKTVAIALGHGSLLNHSSKANAEFYFDYRKKLLIVRARRKIQPGEEITINYRYSSSDRKKFGIV